jgi:type II secretory ATPase GspE/PulE/Tfp pilus assembly ATPase PilB-like protein
MRRSECTNAIHEIFIMNEEVRSLVAKEASVLEIEKAAKRSRPSTPSV